MGIDQIDAFRTGARPTPNRTQLHRVGCVVVGPGTSSNRNVETSNRQRFGDFLAGPVDDQDRLNLPKSIYLFQNDASYRISNTS
jgi:hypothetical protein